jgi:hypothetical protein
MVQRRERLKKQLLLSQLKLIELQGEESLLASTSGSGDVVLLGGDDGEEEELESLEEEEEGPCSPPSVRQTR